MARSCTICEHPDRAALESALQAGASLRRLASGGGVSKTALLRHRDNHLRQAAGENRGNPGIEEAIPAPRGKADRAAAGPLPEFSGCLERADATPPEPTFMVLHDAIGAGDRTFLRGEVVRKSDLGPGADVDRLLLLQALRPATAADPAPGAFRPAGVLSRAQMEAVIRAGGGVLYHGRGGWNDSRTITSVADLPSDEEIVADLRARWSRQGRTWTG